MIGAASTSVQENEAATPSIKLPLLPAQSGALLGKRKVLANVPFANRPATQEAAGDMGAKEIEKLIKLLEAQHALLWMGMRMTDQEKWQSATFEEAAREIGCDEDEALRCRRRVERRK